MNYKTENERKIQNYIARELQKKSCNMCRSENCTSCGYGNPLIHARAIVNQSSVNVNSYNEPEDLKVLDTLEEALSEVNLETVLNIESIKIGKNGKIFVANEKLQKEGIPLAEQFEDEIDTIDGTDWRGKYRQMSVDPSYS